MVKQTIETKNIIFCKIYVHDILIISVHTIMSAEEILDKTDNLILNLK